MEISEKVAYLKGLAEGLALDTETKEGKLIAAMEGRCSMAEAVEAIQRESRRYAKRQITWFKREEQVEFLPIDAFPSRQALLEEAVSLLGKWGVWKGGNACEQ